MKGCYIIVLVVERYENKTQGYALLIRVSRVRAPEGALQSTVFGI